VVDRKPEGTFSVPFGLAETERALLGARKYAVIRGYSVATRGAKEGFTNGRDGSVQFRSLSRFIAARCEDSGEWWLCINFEVRNLLKEQEPG